MTHGSPVQALAGTAVLSFAPQPAPAAGAPPPLAPGDESCTDRVRALHSAEVAGSGDRKTLRFQVYWSANAAGPFTVIDDFEAVSFCARYTEAGTPALIPGYFYVRAQRPARFSGSAGANLTITGR